MKISASIAAVVSVALICIIGCMTIIVISGHDVTIFVVAIGLLFTSATGFVGLFINQKKQADTLETVRGNTNGTLSRILDSYERAVAREAVISSEANPETVRALHEHTLDQTQISEIRDRIAD